MCAGNVRMILSPKQYKDKEVSFDGFTYVVEEKRDYISGL